MISGKELPIIGCERSLEAGIGADFPVSAVPAGAGTDEAEVGARSNPAVRPVLQAWTDPSAVA